MIAEYLIVDNDTLAQLQQLDDDQLADAVIALIESDKHPHVDLGKLWDVLHFVLTKQSATNPVPENPLSEFVLGVDAFSESEDADFIGYTDWAMIAEVVDALEQVNIHKRLDKLTMKALREAKLFPDKIWQDKRENLVKEVANSYTELKALYEQALDTGNNVVISIL